MKKINKQVGETVRVRFKKDPDMTSYFEKMAEGPKLERLNNPCADCAVVHGLYMPFADELSKQTPELQERVLDTWFCHEHRNRACRGAYNFVQLKNRISAREEEKE